MPDVVIRADGLGKKFRIGQQGERERYVALRDVLARRARALLRNGHDMLRGRAMLDGELVEEFWALKDVSFEIVGGDVVGIIGRNGAGKSTLLKILSRITEPSEGRVEIEGRVASLLEVGTGFHPELTGRENVFLNGAILGMSRAEIRLKFDQIVDFAGIEKFLDTPVKRYSSGMYVRLAFAVAAHLESEILIIDEVLAVGDAEFQARCLGRMSEVASGGRTVLFVSHDLAAISALTPRSIVFEEGQLAFEGGTEEAITHYASRSKCQTKERSWGRGKDATLVFAELLDPAGRPTGHYLPGTPLRLRIVLETYGTPGMSFEALLRNERNIPILFFSLGHFCQLSLPEEPGRYECVLSLEPHYLAAGQYYFDLFTTQTHVYDDHYVANAVEFDVQACSPEGTPHNFRQARGYGSEAFKLREPIVFKCAL